MRDNPPVLCRLLSLDVASLGYVQLRIFFVLVRRHGCSRRPRIMLNVLVDPQPLGSVSAH